MQEELDKQLLDVGPAPASVSALPETPAAELPSSAKKAAAKKQDDDDLAELEAWANAWSAHDQLIVSSIALFLFFDDVITTASVFPVTMMVISSLLLFIYKLVRNADWRWIFVDTWFMDIFSSYLDIHAIFHGSNTWLPT